MRKIEQDTINAIDSHRTSWRKANMQVERDGNQVRVYLHGNLIAKMEFAGHLISRMNVTLAGWGTPTTRSRVNALLRTYAGAHAYVHQKDHVQYFTRWQGDLPEGLTKSGPIDPDDWITVVDR